MKGELTLVDELRYFFYITTRRDLSAAEVVRLANARCDQENVVAQLKGGVGAMRVPLYDLLSNWAYMVMAALAWNLKSWFAMMMHFKADRRKYIAMEFRTFIREMILLPCQVIRRARRTTPADHRLAALGRPAVQHLEHDRADRLPVTPPRPLRRVANVVPLRGPVSPGTKTPLRTSVSAAAKQAPPARKAPSSGSRKRKPDRKSHAAQPKPASGTVLAYFRSSGRPSTRRMADFPTLVGVDERLDANYLAIPNTSSERREYVPIGYLSPSVIANQKLRILPEATLADFALLTSAMHMAWMRAVTGRMKSDYMYSVGVVYNTFPMPPAHADLSKLEPLARAVLDARAAYPDATLADLYDPDLMPPVLRRAHQAIDRAVDRLYRRTGFKSERERAEHLFMLYEKMRTPLGIGIKKPKRRRR